MPLPADPMYQLPVRFPSAIGRGYAQTLTLRVEHEGALVAPTVPGSSWVLKSRTGTVLIKAITVVDSIATVTIDASDLEDEPYSNQLMEEWTLVVGGRTLKQQRRASLARVPLEMPASGLDITGVDQLLLRDLGDPATALQPFLEEAWGDIIRYIFRQERWPSGIVDVHELHEPLRELTRAKVRRFLSTSQEDRHWGLYQEHKAAGLDALAKIRVRMDDDQDGVPDTETVQPLQSAFHENGAVSTYIPRWS